MGKGMGVERRGGRKERGSKGEGGISAAAILRDLEGFLYFKREPGRFQVGAKSG